MPKLRAILTTAIEVCEGMSYMHSHRVVHRDLTSGNILLMHEPVAQCVKAKVKITLRRCACWQVWVVQELVRLSLSQMISHSLCSCARQRWLDPTSAKLSQLQSVMVLRRARCRISG